MQSSYQPQARLEFLLLIIKYSKAKGLPIMGDWELSFSYVLSQNSRHPDVAITIWILVIRSFQTLANDILPSNFVINRDRSNLYAKSHGSCDDICLLRSIMASRRCKLNCLLQSTSSKPCFRFSANVV